MDVKNPMLTGKKRRRPRTAARRAERRAIGRVCATTSAIVSGKRASRRTSGCASWRGRLGVSPSLISQIETGKTEPSINTLFAMVSELELSVNEIVFDSGSGLPAERRGRATPRARAGSGRRAGEAAHADAPGSPVQRRTNRTSISLESGVSWHRLTTQPDHNVDFLYLRYPPGSESTPPHSLMRHNGTEYGYVLSGTTPGLAWVRQLRARAGRHDLVRLHAAAPVRRGRGRHGRGRVVRRRTAQHPLGRGFAGRALVGCPLARRPLASSSSLRVTKPASSRLAAPA